MCYRLKNKIKKIPFSHKGTKTKVYDTFYSKVYDDLFYLHLRRFKMVHFRNDNFIINLKVGHSLIPCKFWVSLILK